MERDKTILTLRVEGDPVPKPRQTRRDKWMRRDCVMRYRNYADHLRLAVKRLRSPLPQVEKLDLLFVIRIPPSYGRKRRAELAGRPCKAKPEVDNLCKSILDVIWPAGDSAIAHIEARKIWDDGAGARTEIVFRLEETQN